MSCTPSSLCQHYSCAGIKNRSPAKTLVAIIADQVMIVFGMAAAITSNDTLKAILFVLGASAGFVVFKTVAESFITAYGTYPTEESKRMLVLSETHTHANLGMLRVQPPDRLISFN